MIKSDKMTKKKIKLLKPIGRFALRQGYRARQLLPQIATCLAPRCAKTQEQSCTPSQPHVPLENRESLIYKRVLHLLGWRSSPSTPHPRGTTTSLHKHLLSTPYQVQVCGLFALEGLKNARDEWKDGEGIQPHPRDATGDP